MGLERDFIREALALNGLALRYAWEFQDDRESVLVALQQNPEALQYADPNLRADRELILLAVGPTLATCNPINFDKLKGGRKRDYIKQFRCNNCFQQDLSPDSRLQEDLVELFLVSRELN